MRGTSVVGVFGSAAYVVMIFGLSEAASAQSAAASVARPRYTKADVQFMQGMIGHHAQALVMTGLISGRTTSKSIQLLGQRIDVSQKDEIKLMRHWLEDRVEHASSSDSGHAHQHSEGQPALMPGMLTKDELARLAATKGSEFDRLFLQFMIRHHEGALTMVADLFARPGAGQEAEVFRFASDVEADQRGEIKRMRTMLESSKGRT